MSDILTNIITHNFCINSFEKTEDDTIIKFKEPVMHFNATPNGWGITKEIVKTRMHTLINKHIVTRYYEDTDTLGDHEQESVILRGTNLEIPKTATHGIGTITGVWIAPLDSNNPLSEEVLWCEGILLAMDNINECSLLLEWHENSIPIMTSVEWVYTESIKDENGIKWVTDPTFGNIAILNSEAKNGIPVIYGNYDVANLELCFNTDNLKKFNNAIKLDIQSSLNNQIKEGEGDIVEDEIVKGTEDTTIVEPEVVEPTPEIVEPEITPEVEPEVVEPNEIEKLKKDLESAKEKIKELEVELVSEKELKVELNEKITSLNSTLEELRPLKEAHEKAEYEKALNEKIEQFRPKFQKFNAIDIFDGEEVQELIKKTLNCEEVESAKLSIYEKLDEVIEAFNMETPELNVGMGKVGMEKGLNNLIPKSKNEELYGNL